MLCLRFCPGKESHRDAIKELQRKKNSYENLPLSFDVLQFELYTHTHTRTNVHPPPPKKNQKNPPTHTPTYTETHKHRRRSEQRLEKKEPAYILMHVHKEHVVGNL